MSRTTDGPKFLVYCCIYRQCNFSYQPSALGGTITCACGVCGENCAVVRGRVRICSNENNKKHQYFRVHGIVLLHLIDHCPLQDVNIKMSSRQFRESNQGENVSRGSYHAAAEDVNKDDCQCPACNRKVGERTFAVQCDCCDYWFHLKCTNLSHEVYDAMKNTKMMWFCEKCYGKIAQSLKKGKKEKGNVKILKKI